MSICGRDFGASNTALGTFAGREPDLTALKAGRTTIPSTIFHEVDGALLIGYKAIEAYVEGMPRPTDVQPQIGARHVGDRRNHATRARAGQLSRQGGRKTWQNGFWMFER
jgi:molecular chaperone DnaK (HSP70)